MPDAPFSRIRQKVLDELDRLSDCSRMAYETKPPKWDEIEAAAKRLGVSDWAIRKWLDRGGVPGKWHVPIILESGGRVSIEDFIATPERAA